MWTVLLFSIVIHGKKWNINKFLTNKAAISHLRMIFLNIIRKNDEPAVYPKLRFDRRVQRGSWEHLHEGAELHSFVHFEDFWDFGGFLIFRFRKRNTLSWFPGAKMGWASTSKTSKSSRRTSFPSTSDTRTSPLSSANSICMIFIKSAENKNTFFPISFSRETKSKFSLTQATPFGD